MTSEFRIADTFTDSLARLTGEEQKAVKTTAFDLQMNSAHPSLSFHKLDHARDKNFWSVRASSDIRIIVHKTDASLLLCYVDHHDKAYRWAERRKLETHPKTGAAQLVEIRERIQEIFVPKYVETLKFAAVKPALFLGVEEEALLNYGVPQEWLEDIQNATEDNLLALADHLPSEAAEALLELATGGTPKQPVPASADVNPFDHPDAQRRFRTVQNVEELEQAFAYPWDKWTIFLHPAQRQWVERDYNGPARVSGSAGTGKTVVALHRTVHLARTHSGARVLLATFSETLANALRAKLKRLISSEPRLRERVEVHALDAIAERLYELRFGRPRIATHNDLRGLVEQVVAEQEAIPFKTAFLLDEWEDVVDAWQLDTWESYRDVRRLGRKTRLPEAQRVALWSVFEQVKRQLNDRGWITRAGLYRRIVEALDSRENPPFDYAVIDEAQDISVAQLRFLATLGKHRPDALFFAGDLGQRIFQQPFSWKALGVDVRGRSRTLHINYRTSHQIRTQSDRLLGPEVSDVDGNVEDRRGTVSVFNGPHPDIRYFESAATEAAAVGSWLKQCFQENVQAHEIGVFVRSERELNRAVDAISLSGLPYKILDGSIDSAENCISVGTMHLAKGLEFRVVVVMACDDEVIPSQNRIEDVTDEGDLEEIYDTERYLLYVACTRARDRLWVSGAEPISEFLDDLCGAPNRVGGP